jgi:hypothetical protein
MNSFPREGAARREYRMGRAPQFLLLGFGVLCTGLAVMALRAPANTANALAPIMMIFFLAIGGCLFAWALRARIILDGTRIEVRGLLGERSADLSEIEGFRTFQSRNGSYMKLFLKEGRGTITVSKSFNFDEHFREWFDQVPDLDKRDGEALLEEISHEQELGATPEERLKKLADAKTWSVFLTVVATAAAVALWLARSALLVPATLLLALTPVAAFLLLMRSPLLYAVLKQKADPRAELSIALIVSTIGLLLSMSGLHFVSVRPLLIFMVSVGIAYFLAFQSACRRSTQRQGAIIALLVLAGLYGAGFGLMADTITDQGPATTYSADVLRKRVSHGRSTSYYLVLSPWGPLKSPHQLSVPGRTYRSLQIGDEVCLSVHPGTLRAPWFQLVDCTDRLSPDLTR